MTNRIYTRRPIADRFWEKVDKAGTEVCWNWTGACVSNGYGKLNRRDNGSGLAHRVSWELHFGPVPAGLNVCHTCDNRKCVNPAHLFVASQKENVRDMMEKGRGGWLRGEAHERARLSDAQVRELRHAAGNGVAYVVLAQQFGISGTYARSLALGLQRVDDASIEEWGHAGDEPT